MNWIVTSLFIAIGFMLASMQMYVLAVLMGVCAAFNHEGVLFE